MMFKVVFLIIIVQLALRPSLGAINKKFPKSFNFGTATASYQVEGGWNEGGKGENIWDYFTHTFPDRVVNKDNGDIACDSYNKYLEDVDMLKDLGVNYYRFSLSWSRILPSGFINQVNQEGIQYYQNLIKALKANNIEPYVTLYHWDLPQPLQEIGGWTNEVLADKYVEFARLAFTVFGDDVKNWMTFNEVKQTCERGYSSGRFAPAYTSAGIGGYLCTHTVLKAHARAYHLYDEEFRASQGGRVSIVIDTDWFEPASDSVEDLEATERMMQFNFGWFANPIFSAEGDYPLVMRERVANRSLQEGFQQSRLPKFTPEEVKYIQGTYDFFGLNTYTTRLTKWEQDAQIGSPSYDKDISVNAFRNSSWEDSASDWLKVVPWGIRKVLNWVDKHYDHPEIIITENGFSDLGELEDAGRIHYYSEYLSNVLEAILEDGVNVTGYTAWSLMDNFEWLSGYSQKFGLYHVDFESPNRTRTAKSSAVYIKNVIETRCLVDQCED